MPLVEQELRSLIPPLEPSEHRLLEDSIREDGCRDALVVWKERNVIVDGHNRYDICTKHHIPFRTVARSFPDLEAAKVWIKRNQIARRNLSPYLRAEYAMDISAWEEQKRLARDQQGTRTDLFVNSQRGEAIHTTRELATQIGVGEQTASRIIQVKAKAPDFIKELARRGETSVNEAYRAVKVLDALDVEGKQRVVDLVVSGEARNVFTARTLLQRERAGTIVPPAGRYQVLYADPPWAYDFGLDSHGAAARHYNTMSVRELCDQPIRELADDNAVLFLWVTSPHLPGSFAVIEAWGFEYRTSFVWDKVKHVMGHYNSLRHEFLFVATRGSFVKQSNRLRDSVISIERTGEHSRKPEEFRELVD